MLRDTIQKMYDDRYANEQWSPMVLRPHALSTSRYDDIARLLEAEQGGSLLEVGCGSGFFTIALADRFNRLVGFDLSEVRINTANAALRERYPQYADKVEFCVGSGDEPFPFPDASFDVVVAAAVIEHVVDLFLVMDEIARVCKPGGGVAITVPNICYIKHVLEMIRGHVPITGGQTRDIREWRAYGWDGGHLHYFSKSALAALLENCGFKPVKWTGDGKWAKLRRWHVNFVGNLTVLARRQQEI